MTIIRPALLKTLLILAGLSLSACLSILPDPKTAPTVYRLNVPQQGSQSTTPVTDTIAVNIEYPTASKAIGGTDITVSPDGRRLTAASGARWAEPVQSLLRNALLDKLANTNGVTGVIPKGNTRVPYRLHMDIRRFEAVFDNGEDAAPNAVIQLNLSLTNTKTRTLIGTKTVQANTRARARSVSAIVDANAAAANEAMQETSTWIAGLLAGHKS